MKNNIPPPYLRENSKLILFDGVCKLCNAWSRFIIKYDTNRIFTLASVQSQEGQAILTYLDMPTEYFDTMLYVEGTRAFNKSDAFLKIVSQLNLPWRALVIVRVIPHHIRDWCYDRIALNRYTLFGKYDQCLLPSPDHDERFLNNGH